MEISDVSSPTDDMIQFSMCIFEKLIKLYPEEKRKVIESLLEKTCSLHQLWKIEFQNPQNE